MSDPLTIALATSVIINMILGIVATVHCGDKSILKRRIHNANTSKNDWQKKSVYNTKLAEQYLKRMDTADERFESLREHLRSLVVLSDRWDG